MLAIILWGLLIWWIIGVVVNIIAMFCDPILFYAWMLVPVGAFIWPYILWVVILFPDNTGRWI